MSESDGSLKIAIGSERRMRWPRSNMVAASAFRALEQFDGKNRPLLFAAWPEWDYAWSLAKPGAASDDDMLGG
jgi:hypothetical protein